MHSAKYWVTILSLKLTFELGSELICNISEVATQFEPKSLFRS